MRTGAGSGSGKVGSPRRRKLSEDVFDVFAGGQECQKRILVPDSLLSLIFA